MEEWNVFDLKRFRVGLFSSSFLWMRETHFAEVWRMGPVATQTNPSTVGKNRVALGLRAKFRDSGNLGKGKKLRQR